ncbi:hypothetical protein HZ326_24990 [Fusarium oxysporum f. sp. albedinis]|nr:hypothetical protein HZ326_24990 [Fusarium oxysporum f. sp. albedinis]
MGTILIWMATLERKCLSLVDDEPDYGHCIDSLNMGTILIWIVTLDRKCLSLLDEDSDHGHRIDLDGDSRK